MSNSECDICYLENETYTPCNKCNIKICNNCWKEFIKSHSSTMFTIICAQCRTKLPIYNPENIKIHEEVIKSEKPYNYNFRDTCTMDEDPNIYQEISTLITNLESNDFLYIPLLQFERLLPYCEELRKLIHDMFIENDDEDDLYFLHWYILFGANFVPKIQIFTFPIFF